MAKKKIYKLFLTINAGEKAEPADVNGFKRYIGVAPVTVTAINPTKKELEDLYGFSVEQEPDYKVERDDRKAFRLEFHVRTVQNSTTDIDTTGRINFFVSNEFVSNRDQSKWQVIDDYGETSWVTTEQFQAGQRPDNCKLVGPYRKCHRGEAELIMFIKEWLNFKSSVKWDENNHRWVPVSQEELEKCTIKLDWEQLCAGNIQEFKDLVPIYKDYAVKVCFGIRTTEDNRHYQEICNRVFIKNSSRNYNKFEKDINSLKRSGMYANTEFSSDFLREWHVQQTTFTNTISDQPIENADIFGNTVDNKPENYEGSNDLPF